MPKSHFLGNATGDDGAEQQPAEAAAAPAPAPTPEQAYHDQVRAALLRNAQANFDRTVHAADGGYSRQLKQQSDALTKYMRRQQGSPQAGAVMLDPNEFMAGLALGMKDKEVAEALLTARHVPHDDKMVKHVAEAMRTSYRFPYGEGNKEATTQNPHAFADFFTNNPTLCPIVPASAYFPPEMRIPGTTHQQNLDLVNLHEAWHCRDTRNKIVGLTKEQSDKMEGEPPQMAIGDPVKLQAYATANAQETLADVGAAGDLIRKGADPKTIIESMTAWRADAYDTEHMTVAGLQELKHRIDDMGVGKFRKLNDDQARALYNDCAEKGAMSPAVVGQVISYMTSSEEIRELKRDLANTNPDLKQAVDAVAPYRLHAGGPPPPVVQPLTPDEQKIADQLRAYDAAKMLQDRAFRDAHKITPGTLVKAYGEMQEDLRRKIDKDPDNPLWQAQAVKLQESFVHVTSTLDYVDANAKRGVDILKAEASLSRFSFDPNAPAAPPPEPAAPQPDKPAGRKPPLIGDASNGPSTEEGVPPPTTGALRARRPTPGM